MSDTEEETIPPVGAAEEIEDGDASEDTTPVAAPLPPMEDSDPEPDRASDPEAWGRWKERTRKRRMRAAKTARTAKDSRVSEIVPASEGEQAVPRAPEQKGARARAVASRVKRTRKAPTTTPDASNALQKRLESAQALCTAVATGTLALIPSEYGQGDLERDAALLGDAWGPVVAPYLETDNGELNPTAALVAASVITAQVLIVRYVNARKSASVPRGYSAPAPAPVKDGPAPDAAPADTASEPARSGYLPDPDGGGEWPDV